MTHAMKDVFGVVDYVVFGIMLAISAGIGVYYAFADRKKSNTQEFLMGGRSLSTFPVAMSVLASFMSAITLLGTPAEIYRYGTQYIMISIAYCFVIPATAYLYLPVFYNLGITSAYEYLELRFHKVVRTAGSVVFSLGMIMYMPVVMYAPALALAEVTGIQIWPAVLSIGLVCTFYTSIGGIKAVVWTDLFQSLMMYASILVVVIKGSIDLGGFNAVWKKASEGERVDFFNFDMDPTTRHTFWSLVIGGYITWMGNYAANQAMIQRYLTIGTLKGAQRCLWINLPALLLLLFITSLSGLVIYAFYVACDPIGTKIIQSPDQLFPRFVMETFGSLPGIPGLFVSGIFSGALSTVSSGVNSLVAVFLEDFIKPYIAKDLSELWATRITKALAVVFGLLSIALVYVAQQLGGVLQAALALLGVVGGPMLGLFSLGMFFPFANTWGASSGLVSGFIMAFWLLIGSFTNNVYHPKAPVLYNNCSELYYNVTQIDIFSQDNIVLNVLPWNDTAIAQNFTSMSLPEVTPNNDHIFWLYRLSYLWLSAIGFAVVLIVGVIVSLLTGANNGRDIDQRLLSPIVPWLTQFLPGGRCKKLTLNRDKKGTSLATLRTTSVISDLDFYPSKKVPISDIPNSKPS